MVDLAAVNKRELLDHLIRRLESDLQKVTAAQKATQEGATHPENRSESDKDMRATEVSYLARGQAERVISLRDELGLLRSLTPRSFGPESPIAATALLRLEFDEGSGFYFFVPAGGGLRLALGEGSEASVLTPRSPLGQNLLGMKQGDIVGLDTSDGSKEYEIAEVA